MPVILKNNAFSTLATAITASDTGIVVADGSKFPALSAGEYFYATLVSPAGTTEIIKVTARVGNSLTVVRAQDGSSAASFQVGARLDMRVNAASIAEISDEASEISIADAGGYYTATDVEGALQEAGADLRTQAAQVRDTVATLLADTVLTYTAGQVGTVTTGDIIRTRAEGFSYEVAASGATDQHVTTAGGVKLYVLRSDRGWNMLAFGADNTGVSDVTAIFQKVLDIALADRTGPTQASGPNRPSNLVNYGQDVIYFPKGKYRVNTGVVAASSIIGLEVCGDAPYTTSIEYHSDSGTFFTGNTFIRYVFRDLLINHVPQNADNTTWTNNLYTGSGVSGGRMLRFENVAVFSFNRVVNNTGVVNFDTFSAENSDFFGFNCFYFGRNSQALINSIRHCTFFGQGDVMQIAGVGHTLFESCNIVVEGAWLNLYGMAGRWGPTSQFTFENVKGEPWNSSGYGGGARSQIVKFDPTGDKTFVTCQIKLINSGMTSALTVDPAYPMIELNANMNIDWQGGQLKETTTIKLWPTQLLNANSLNHRGLFFDGLRLIPPPSQITREAAVSSNTTYPQVVYERCQVVPNICLGWEQTGVLASFPPVMDRAIQTNCLGNGSNFYGVLSFGGAMTHTLNFYGTPQAIEEIIVSVSRKNTNPNLVVEISLDNFATTLETLTIVAAAGSSYIDLTRAVTSIGKVGTDRLYVRCSGAEAYGYIQATVRAV